MTFLPPACSVCDTPMPDADSIAEYGGFLLCRPCAKRADAAILALRLDGLSATIKSP